MAAEVHLGDIGTAFYGIVRDQDSVYVDLTAATGMVMKFRKPTGEVVEQTATKVTTYSGTDADIIAGVAADAVMGYVSVAGDLDVRGEWRVQGFATIGAWTGHTDQHRFVVHGNL